MELIRFHIPRDVMLQLIDYYIGKTRVNDIENEVNALTAQLRKHVPAPIKYPFDSATAKKLPLLMKRIGNYNKPPINEYAIRMAILYQLKLKGSDIWKELGIRKMTPDSKMGGIYYDAVLTVQYLFKVSNLPKREIDSFCVLVAKFSVLEHNYDQFFTWQKNERRITMDIPAKLRKSAYIVHSKYKFGHARNKLEREGLVKINKKTGEISYAKEYRFYEKQVRLGDTFFQLGRD